MRFLANENFPFDAVEALRKAGHDIAWVRKDAPGSPDRQVLQRAIAESRILITFDKDFGELAFRSGLPATCGVILFRIQCPSSQYIANFAVKTLGARSDWAGNFSVIEDHRVRIRTLGSSD